MSVMAKEKPKSKKEQRVSVTYRIHPAILAAVDKYRTSLDFAPSQAKVVEKALVEFLEARSFEVPGLPDADDEG